MKVKFKLTLGIGLLFLLIVLSSGVGTWYIHALKTDTENILVANYNTLEYSRSMLLALDEIEKDSTAITRFEKSLLQQQRNITELGERETTDKIARHFQKLKRNPIHPELAQTIRTDISEVMRLNMEAIQRKSTIAQATAKTAIFWIAIAGTSCFLIAFILLVNLPRSIANPIEELTTSIKEISDQNYSQRVHFEDHNEFGELAQAFNKMAEKLEEYNNSNLSKILFEKKRIETIINNMTDPVIGLDQNKCILFANEKALNIIGLKPEYVIGKNALELSLTNDLIRLLLNELATPALNYSKEKKVEKIYANGKESFFEKEWLDIIITPTGETQQQLIGHVILLKDITSFKELDAAKTNFISTISHELKTPLASIGMTVQLMKNEKTGILNQEQKYLLTSINEDTERLLKITRELLNITQLESGNISLNIRPTEMSDLIAYAISANKTFAEQKKVSVKVSQVNTSIKAMVDGEKTAWVITNLISNAIRYSPEHSTIIVTLNQENSKVICQVKDNGQGIDQQYKEKIFDRYFRVPGSQTEGSGLGLAISKEFMEAQGGQIKVESSLGVGSTFTLIMNASEAN